MVRKLVAIGLSIELLVFNTAFVFAQPDFKFPWDASLGKIELTSGPHGGTGICTQKLISTLTALDFGLGNGTEVLASAAGTVEKTGEESLGGNYVWIDHGDGWQTGYYHLSSILVKEGDYVMQGTLIAKSGKSGSGATGYHLHFVIKPELDGVIIDGYRVRAVQVLADRSKGFNYLGTLTKGSESEKVVSGQCSNEKIQVEIVGDQETVSAEDDGKVSSTNRKIEGIGSYLIRPRGDHPIYFLENGVRRWVPEPDTLGAIFHSIPIQDLDPSVVASIPRGSDIPSIHNGWVAAYYNNPSRSQPPIFVRAEGPNLNWGTGSPGAGIPGDRFSARFAGILDFPLSGPYTFHGVFDDVGIVYFDHQPVLNYRFACCPPSPQPVWTMNVSAGRHIIHLDFTEDYGGAAAYLWWDSPVRPQGSAAPLFAAQGEDDWYNTAVPIRITGSSPYGLSQVAWQFEPREDGDWKYVPFSGNSATLPPVSQDGIHQIRYNVSDIYGNWGEEKILEVRIDKNPPLTELSHDDPSYENGGGKLFVSPETTFTLEAEDNLSGVAQTNYQIDGSGEQVYEEEFLIGGEDGKHEIRYQSDDLAGNSEPQNTQEVYLDSTPPVSSDDSDGEWHNEDVTVLITAEDPSAPDGTVGSGVKVIYYSGAKEGIAEGDRVVVIFENEGVHELSYFVVDNVENIEGEKHLTLIKIDKTPPEVIGALTASPNENGWYSEDVIVQFEAEDQPGLSGLKSVTPDVVVSTESRDQEVVGTAEDNAGNTASTTVGGINIDKTAPRTTAAVDPEEPDGDNDWYRSDVEITLEVTDENPLNPEIETSGVRRTNVTITQDGVQESSSYEEWDVSLPFEEDGIYEVEFYSEDWAGNVEDPKTVPFKIDQTPPVIEGRPDRKPNAYGWYNDDVTVHFEATDNLSGVASVTEDRVIETEGAGQSVEGVAVDIAGNSSTAVVFGINIDKTQPESFLEPLAPYYNNNPLDKNPIELNYEAFDNLSGLQRVRLYKRWEGDPEYPDWDYHYWDGLDGELQALGSFNVKSLNFDGELHEGRWEFASSAVDLASNIEGLPGEADTSTVYDITAPRTSLDKPAANENDWYNEDVEVILEATDEHPVYPEIETSGVSQTVVIIFKDGELLTNSFYQKWDIAPPFEEDGIYLVKFYSEDRAGNIEEPDRTVVQLDKTEPSSEITSFVESQCYYDAEKDLWHCRADNWPGIYGVAGDTNPADPSIETSGVAQVEIRVDKDGKEGNWEPVWGTDSWELVGFIPSDGVYVVYSRATDKAGNQESTFMVSFVYDNTTPSVPTTSIPSGSFTEGEVLKVSLTAEAGVEIYYFLNGSAEILYFSPITITGDTVLSAYAIDKAGNRSASVEFKYIFNPPSLPAAGISPQVLGIQVEDGGEEIGESNEVKGEETAAVVGETDGETNPEGLGVWPIFLVVLIGGVPFLLLRRWIFLRRW